jgi:hypothetical protein
MEYGTYIADENKMRYVGYEQSNDCIKKYYSEENVRKMSKKITELLMGVDPQNRPIIVPDSTITSIMSEVYQAYRPMTGDIYSRYIIPNGTNSESYVEDMINRSIEIIVSDVRNNLGMEEYNKTLTAWTTVYGDFNEHGLQSHPQIKVLGTRKRPSPLQFNMNY